MKRAFVIAIEGIDGAGKTTQTNLLADRIMATKVRFPNDCPGSITYEDIRKFLRRGGDAAMASYAFIMNMIECLGEFVNLIENSDCVVVDRYLPSTIVYRSALTGEPVADVERKLRGLSESIGIPSEDMVIWLDVDPEIAFERIKDRNKEETIYELSLDTLKQLRQNYYELYQRNGNWIHIDLNNEMANSHPNKVLEMITGLLHSYLTR